MHRTGGLLLVTLALCAGAGAQKPKPDEPLRGAARKAFTAKIGQRMRTVRTVVAEFVQEKHYSLFDEVVKQSGVILYQRPDKLRWEIQEPFRSILIVAGTEVAKFEFQKKVRKKLALGRAKDVLLIVMDQIRGWFRGDFEKSQKDYDVDFYGGESARIVMRPKSKSLRKTVQSFELKLAKDLTSVTRVTIHEQSGDKTVMRFDKFAGETKLDAAHFDVDAPRETLPKRPAKKPPRKEPSKTSKKTPAGTLDDRR